jgi:hypothetical protein
VDATPKQVPEKIDIAPVKEAEKSKFVLEQDSESDY